MALDRAKLQRVGGALPQLHIYDAAADNIATVTASGYFNAVTDQLRNKDVIIVISTAGSVIDLIFVGSATGAAVVTTIGAEGITATVLAAQKRDNEKVAKDAEKADKELKEEMKKAREEVVIPKNPADAREEAKADLQAEEHAEAIKDPRAGR